MQWESCKKEKDLVSELSMSLLAVLDSKVTSKLSIIMIHAWLVGDKVVRVWRCSGFPINDMMHFKHNIAVLNFVESDSSSLWVAVNVVGNTLSGKVVVLC